MAPATRQLTAVPRLAPPACSLAFAFRDDARATRYSRALQHRMPSGVYVVPSPERLTEWHGIIFVGPDGPLSGGAFKFVLTVPETYPDGGPTGARPRIRFVSRVLHPLVAPDTGEFGVHHAFPVWHKHEHFIWQLLCYLQRSLHAAPEQFNASDALNTAAIALARDDPAAYEHAAQACAKDSRAGLCSSSSSSSDGHAIPFGDEWRAEYDVGLQAILRIASGSSPAAAVDAYQAHLVRSRSTVPSTPASAGGIVTVVPAPKNGAAGSSSGAEPVSPRAQFRSGGGYSWVVPAPTAQPDSAAPT